MKESLWRLLFHLQAGQVCNSMLIQQGNVEGLGTQRQQKITPASKQGEPCKRKQESQALLKHWGGDPLDCGSGWGEEPCETDPGNKTDIDTNRNKGGPYGWGLVWGGGEIKMKKATVS